MGENSSEIRDDEMMGHEEMSLQPVGEISIDRDCIEKGRPANRLESTKEGWDEIVGDLAPSLEGEGEKIQDTLGIGKESMENTETETITTEVKIVESKLVSNDEDILPPTPDIPPSSFTPLSIETPTSSRKKSVQSTNSSPSPRIASEDDQNLDQMIHLSLEIQQTRGQKTSFVSRNQSSKPQKRQPPPKKRKLTQSVIEKIESHSSTSTASSKKQDQKLRKRDNSKKEKDKEINRLNHQNGKLLGKNQMLMEKIDHLEEKAARQPIVHLSSPI
ncbi:unnamed protein product, partial [Mesorhabditis belari]|uniref:Uncharacterized protein n=1 Tax=Mesorhabditis belari TaxID=2138241 RepID=A0AAF3ET25_9BILA